MSRQNSNRTTTYNLSSARNIAALEALLLQDEDGQDERKPRRSKPNDKPKPGKSDKERLFYLKEDGPRRGHSTTPSPALQELQAMFHGSCDPAVVADVLASCGGDQEAALQALLDITGAHPARAPAQAGRAPACPGSLSNPCARPPPDPAPNALHRHVVPPAPDLPPEQAAAQ
jgi:hypothetical protein